MAQQVDSTLGVDLESTLIDGVWDISGTSSLVRGARDYVLAIARRLSTAPGTLSRHREYGYDVYALRGVRVPPDATTAIEGAIEAQCRLDERTLSAKAIVRLLTQRVLTIRVEVASLAGPFALVFDLAGDEAVPTIVSSGTVQSG